MSSRLHGNNRERGKNAINENLINLMRIMGTRFSFFTSSDDKKIGKGGNFNHAMDVFKGGGWIEVLLGSCEGRF